MKLTNKNNKEFASRLKDARIKAGLTQTELANKMGKEFYQVDVSGYESGKRKPLPENLAKIAKILHVDKDWLDVGEGEVDYDNTTYGKYITIKHVTSKTKKNELSSMYDKLSSDSKSIVNELISVLSDENDKNKAKK